jgi:hypothetical protein
MWLFFSAPPPQIAAKKITTRCPPTYPEKKEKTRKKSP